MNDTLNQRVSPHAGENAKLDTDQRLENVEHDIVVQTDEIRRLVKQNDKYTDYLDDRIKREKESYKFWVDVRKRLAVAGILGAVGLLGAALWYAFTQFVNNTGGG